MNTAHDVARLVRRKTPTFDGALESRADLVERLGQRRFSIIQKNDLIAGRGADLADAATHLAGADDPDRLDVFVRHHPCRLRPFHHYGQRLAASDAETREPSPRAMALHGVDQCRKDARARGADRMAERDGPAVDVHSLGVELQLAIDG